MATIDYWAEAPMNREQIALFSPTLDSVIGDDDPVRLFDEVLVGIDWSQWEAEYHGRVGQPPIHPRQLAAAILYGLYRRIRSSRQLEEATHYRLDFIWLLHGRRVDHTTLAKFRTRFRKPLKGLFRQLGRLTIRDADRNGPRSGFLAESMGVGTATMWKSAAARSAGS